MSESPLHWVRRAGNLLLVGSFLVVIALPLLATLCGFAASTTEMERRKPAPFPSLEGKLSRKLRAFPAGFEAYFNDRFAFRGELVRSYNQVCVSWLKSSPAPLGGFADTGLPAEMLDGMSSRVLVGRDGWLFLSGGRTLDSYRCQRPFTDVQLARWHQVLSKRTAWLAERGVVYLVMFAPDKHNIYPECMPDCVTRADTVSRLDQLSSYLRRYGGVRHLDLRPALLAAKQQIQVYPKTDTHWNDAGAQVACREIIASLQGEFPRLLPRERNGYQIKRKQRPGGDLSIMLGISKLLPEVHILLKPTEGWQASLTADNNRSHSFDAPWRASAHPDPSLPRLLVIHDSFMQKLQPFLSEHFSRASFYWSHEEFDPAAIERDRPQVVIHELVERKLSMIEPEELSELSVGPQRWASRDED